MRNHLLARLAVLATLTLSASPVLAQVSGEVFSGFSSGSDQPINIEADRLEVRDPEKLAIYTGNVNVEQAGTIMKTTELRVLYTGEASNGAPGSSVDRIEAGSPVLVQSGDQTATGERAVFEMQKDLVTLSGDVVLTQGDNVVRGERLVVDLNTQQARIEGGRVQTILAPQSNRDAGQ